MKKIYLDEVRATGEELIQFTKNDITSKIEELKLVTKDLIWQGQAYNNFIEGSNAKIVKLEQMNDSLSNIANFLITVNDNYGETNRKIDNAYEELIEDFKKVGEQ